jgi:sec-independent protein translocase protein TatC
MVTNTENTQFDAMAIQNDEMALSEHIEEFSQRIIFCLIVLSIATIACFTNIKELVQIIQVPALGIKFLQFAPGEYFFASVKIAAFCGILASSPIVIYQIFLYVVPGMTKNERNIILPVTLSSCILFLCGLIFAYFFLVPAALKFFIAYGADVVEPFWSFNQYFDFVAILIFATGIAFQIPVIQIILGLLNIITGQKNVIRLEICNSFSNNYCCNHNTINGSNNPNRSHNCIICFIFRRGGVCNFIK